VTGVERPGRHRLCVRGVSAPRSLSGWNKSVDRTASTPTRCPPTYPMR